MNQNSTRFSLLSVGDSASIGRRYRAAELVQWAAIAGAPEPDGHVPEPLIAALFSNLLGEQVPGHGTNYLKQQMRFHDQGQVGEELTATVTISRLRPDKSLVNLETRCTGEDGRLVCSGEALVLFKH
ncbi:MAG: hypothetical protein JJU06_07200 [Ectothiorhodospiraceae bacterium]|nr:hypothetical protein [Ectothiorhodospiraceae bacterium]MCH8505349.1 hypothetical protein [Ectothiorhodospiraceae bacterium]